MIIDEFYCTLLFFEIVTVFEELHDGYSIVAADRLMDIFCVTRIRKYLNRIEIYREPINGK
jgi:hypothetical protein